MMRKKLIALTLLIGSAQLSCTDNFDAINTDPTRASSAIFDPNLLLPSIQYNHVNANSGYNGPILFQAGWIQILASTTSGAANYYSNADKYVISSNTNDYLQRTWSIDYTAASYAYEMEQLTNNNAALVNLNNIAKIMQVQCLANITDTYGDVPYTQALQAKSNGVTLPAYDSQDAIYKNMLSRLETATAALSSSAALPTNDAFAYKGDITKWKKFGYSLMLKLAMRLTKSDLATAKTYAEKAVAGGVFTSVDDDAYVVANNANGYGNSNGQALTTGADIYQVRWSKTLIDYLKATNDPRLSVVSEVPVDGLAANQLVTAGNSTPSAQLGLPNGYDLNGGATDISKSPGYPGGTGSGADATPIGKYSRPTTIYRNRDAPLFVLTYAETELLLAEAATRGFTVGGTAAGHYKNGVVAGMQSLAKYGTGGTISSTTASTYADANPLVAANALKQINEQIWATTGLLMNFMESWNNWKRSGFPALTPVNYTGNFSNGQIPRRQPYPTNEATLNTASYTSAVSKLSGGDNWTSRVYWDKQ